MRRDKINKMLQTELARLDRIMSDFDLGVIDRGEAEGEVEELSLMMDIRLDMDGSGGGLSYVGWKEMYQTLQRECGCRGLHFAG